MYIGLVCSGLAHQPNLVSCHRDTTPTYTHFLNDISFPWSGLCASTAPCLFHFILTDVKQYPLLIWCANFGYPSARTENCFFWIFFWSFPGCSLIHLQSFVYLFAHVPTKALSPNPTSIPVPGFTLNQRIRIMTNSVEMWFILSSTTITRIDVVS